MRAGYKQPHIDVLQAVTLAPDAAPAASGAPLGVGLKREALAMSAEITR